MKHYERGDTVNADFLTEDLILDGTWHELDLSGIVTKEAAVNMVHLAVTTTGKEQLLFRRATNDALNTLPTCTPGCQLPRDRFVPCDANRKIVYQANPGLESVTITVCGWWVE